MKNSISEIKNYIIFLKKELNLEITLHPTGDERLISESELISFNIHENPHCLYVKTFSEAQEHCVSRQEKITEKCKAGSFCGTCYAGIKEYIYPITNGEKNVGFICVSGYRDENYISYMSRCSERFDIPLENLKKSISSLKKEMPPKAYIDTVINPLLRMLELAYGKSHEKNLCAGVIDRIIRYVNRNYAHDITLGQICSEFSCSRSYVSHNFKKATGQTFREYITYLRLRSARHLLENTKLSISEIALSLGFCNSNHFSGVFRSYFHISPRSYRHKQ